MDNNKIDSSTTLVYRVACKDDVTAGMYSNGAALHVINYSDAHHPAPTDDSKLSYSWLAWKDRACFGFATIAQLRRWIYYDEWLRSLHEVGQALFVIEVPDKDFRAGHTQAIYLPDNAKVVEVRSILSLIEDSHD